MNLKERIMSLCKQNNTNAKQIETQLGLGAGTISKWGTSSPKLNVIVKVADYFNVSLDYLAGRDVINLENKKLPKELKKILEEEAIALNGRLMNDEDKQRMYLIITAAFLEAKEMNKRKK